MFLFFKNINIITSSFEITNSTGKLHKDFRTLFVFKHRRKTKKFTLKWQIPLIEKRVFHERWKFCQRYRKHRIPNLIMLCYISSALLFPGMFVGCIIYNLFCFLECWSGKRACKHILSHIYLETIHIRAGKFWLSSDYD